MYETTKNANQPALEKLKIKQFKKIRKQTVHII